MLFHSTADEVIKRMFAQAQETASDARKAQCVKRLSYYHDEMTSYIKEMLEKHHTEPDMFDPTFFNITKKIINNLAMVYLQNATRTLGDATPNDDIIYKDIVQTSNLDVKMKIASRYTQLLKTILLRPVWRNNKLDVDILTGDVLDVEVGDVPDDLKTVMITHYPQNGKLADVTYSLWDDKVFKKLDSNMNILKTEPNPYGVVPFIPVWDQYPAIGSFWQAGGDDIENIQDAISLKLSDLMVVIEYQGFGIPVLKGSTTGGKVSFGPDVAIELADPSADFTFAKTNAPIQQILNSIEFLAKQAAITNGLSAASLSVKPTQESGLARIAGSVELTQLRIDQISLFGRYERQLFDMIKLIWNTHNTANKMSDTCRLKCDFYDPSPSLSPDKQAELWDKELQMGTISRLDIIMLKNPDLSREDALIKLEEIRQENETFKPSNISPTAA